MAKIDKEFFSVYINLLKTVIGVGLLLYPSLIKHHGILNVMISSIISSFFSICGLMLYAVTNKHIGKRSTMSSIALDIVPEFRLFVDVCVAIKCFGVGVIYIIIVKDCLSFIRIYFAQYMIVQMVSHETLLLIFYILVAPLSYIEKMSKLRFTSFIGSTSILLILLLNITRYLSTMKTHSLPPLTINNSAITNLSSFVYGFTCHQNIFTIQNEMKKTSIIRLLKIITCVMCTTLMVYWTFGIVNFKIFGDEISDDNLFALYCKENTIQSLFVCILFVVMLLLSFPLQSIPCRIYSTSLIGSKYGESAKCKYCFTTILLVTSYLLAVCDFGVKKCMSLVGGSVSSAICFIICSVYYINLGKKRMSLNILAYVTLLFGLAVFIGFLYKTVTYAFK